MKNLKTFTAVLISLIIVSACSTDYVEPSNLNETSEVNESESDKSNTSSKSTKSACIEAIQEYEKTNDGTICCVSGSTKASPGTTGVYEYHSNITNASITWEVISGAITIVGDQNSSSVTFEFGSDFTGGEILGVANGDNVCSEPMLISQN